MKEILLIVLVNILLLIWFDIAISMNKKRSTISGEFLRNLYWNWIRIKSNFWNWFLYDLVKHEEGEKYTWWQLILSFIIFPTNISLFLSSLRYKPWEQTLQIDGIKLSVPLLRQFGKGGFRKGEYLKIVDRDEYGNPIIKRYNSFLDIMKEENYSLTINPEFRVDEKDIEECEKEDGSKVRIIKKADLVSAGLNMQKNKVNIGTRIKGEGEKNE